MTPGACSVCGGSLEVRHADVRDPYGDASYRVLDCTRCGLGHTDPRPEAPEAAYPPAYHGARHGITDALCMRRRVRIVLSRQAGGKLLDVGCGDGTFLREARRRGFDVAGTELSAAPVAAAGDLRILPGIEACAAGGPYHAITLWHSLEHLPDPVAALARLGPMLAPGGVLVAAVPDAGGWQARLFGPLWLHRDVPRHLHHFGKRSLVEALERAGLAPRAFRHAELEYDLFGWIQSALDAVMPHRQVLFRMLTGRAAPAGVLERGLNVAMLALLAPPALLLTGLSALAGRGGTLVVVATARSLS